MRLLVLLTLILFTENILCQKILSDSDVHIIAGNKPNQLYANNPHALIISSEKYYINDLIVTLSQGKVERYDTPEKPVHDIMYSISDLKIGSVTIKVFIKTDTGLQLLNKRSLKVVKRPLTKEEKSFLSAPVKPEVSLEGYKYDSIPLSVLKRAKRLEVNKPYRLQKAILNYGSVRHGNPSVIYLHSEEFNSRLINLLSKIKTGKDLLFGFDEIEVVDPTGKVYSARPLYFRIISDN